MPFLIASLANVGNLSQAESTRKLSKHVKLSELAPVALDQVAVLTSICNIAKTPAEIKSELMTWWDNEGSNLLFKQIHEDEEEELTDEEVEADQTVLDQGAKEAEDLVSAVESTKTQALIEEELVKMNEEVGKGDKGCEDPALPKVPDYDDFEMEDEEAELATHLTADVFTLEQVLERAGMLHFQPPKDDYEVQSTMRTRKLLKHSQQMVAALRVGEGILSRASALGCKRRKGMHQLWEHQLALARLSFQCSSERQSRHTMWMNFQERVFSDIKQQHEAEGGEGNVKGAQPIQKLGPCAVHREHGRHFQLLVVRPFAAAAASGGLRFGLVTAAWRCNRSSKSKQKMVPQEPIPFHMLTTIHVLLLMPFTDRHGQVHFIAA